MPTQDNIRLSPSEKLTRWLACYREVMQHQWVRPGVVTSVLCLVAVALLWYGTGVLFDRPPESGDAASLGY
jgi:hypothetical protein